MFDGLKTYQKTLAKGLAALSLSGIGWLVFRAQLPQSIDIKIARILLLCILACIIFWILIGQRINRKAVETKLVSWKDDYIFIQNSGIYRHKTKPGVFCAGCFLKDLASPMKVIEHGWFCPGCEKRYPDPDNPPPKRERISIRPVKGWWD